MSKHKPMWLKDFQLCPLQEWTGEKKWSPCCWGVAWKLPWWHKVPWYIFKKRKGQSFVHLASRTAIFRLKFVQRYLTGPPDLVWRNVASCISRRLNNLGLDAPMFLTDVNFLKLSRMPRFYQGVFKFCAKTTSWPPGTHTERQVLHVRWKIQLQPSNENQPHHVVGYLVLFWPYGCFYYGSTQIPYIQQLPSMQGRAKG